jgi:hypothetical protein
MKELLGLAVAVAGMSFGVSYANANPAVPAVGCDCAVVLRNGTVASFTGAAREEIHVRYAENGNVVAKCQVDLGAGSQQNFDISNTGFNCFIDGVPTANWHEVISASGQTTITCEIKK